MQSSVRPLTCAALFAALTGILTQIAIPLPGLVPINLATLSVFLSGALLGAKWGIISQLVYLCLGIIGIPVFSGMRSGIGMLAGVTGGYLIGYLLAALLIGFLMEQKPARFMLPVSMILGILACYLLGTMWYLYSTWYLPAAATGAHPELLPAVLSALAACVFPFIPGDVLKILAASLIVQRIGILKYRPKP